MSDDENAAWRVACRSMELKDRPLGRLILDTPVVLFRDAKGHAAALRDRCPHGLGPLSTGYLSENILVCAYHGLRVDREGHCVDARLSSSAREAAKVQTFAVEERDGILWVWMEDPPARIGA
jgi:phenylpropionate dioxygenase-like ring-hydroxylating dioxygenase large terminal subunit